MTKLKTFIKEARFIDPDDAGQHINAALDDLKYALKHIKNPEDWAEKYIRSLPGVLDMIDRLVSIFGRMK